MRCWPLSTGYKRLKIKKNVLGCVWRLFAGIAALAASVDSEKKSKRWKKKNLCVGLFWWQKLAGGDALAASVNMIQDLEQLANILVGPSLDKIEFLLSWTRRKCGPYLDKIVDLCAGFRTRWNVGYTFCLIVLGFFESCGRSIALLSHLFLASCFTACPMFHSFVSVSTYV